MTLKASQRPCCGPRLRTRCPDESLARATTAPASRQVSTENCIEIPSFIQLFCPLKITSPIETGRLTSFYYHPEARAESRLHGKSPHPTAYASAALDRAEIARATRSAWDTCSRLNTYLGCPAHFERHLDKVDRANWAS